MKKILKFLFAIIPILLVKNVYAECTYADQVAINGKAANVKVAYEVAQGKVPDGTFVGCDGEDECDYTYKYFKITILNLDEDLVVKVKNNYDNTVKSFTHRDADENGIITFDWNTTSVMTTFTFDISSSSTALCPNKKQLSQYLTTPRKNVYSTYSQCEGLEDNYLCEDFVTYEELSFAEFYQKIEEAKEEAGIPPIEEQTFWQKVEAFINENKGWIVLGAVGLIVITTTVIIVVRKKRNVWEK